MEYDLTALALEGVRSLQPYQPGRPLDEVARELNLDPAAIVKLASNENPLGPSPVVLDALGRAVHELSRYPDGNGFYLKQALSERYGVATDCITLGNGSNDVLQMLALAYLSPGRNAVFSAHAFAVYPIVTQAAGAQCRIVPAVDWGHDLAAMAEAIDKDTRIVFIANPNNPTGTWSDKTDVKAFLDQVPENVLVVLDEAYAEYVTESEYPDGTAWLKDYPNLVVTRTFSKAFGLAGLRVGYGLSHNSVADMLNRVRQPFNVNSMALSAACAALSDMDYLQNAREINEQGMQQLETGLTGLGLTFIPSVGNFISFQCQQDAAAVNDGLLHRGVIVRPVANYNMPNYLRVSIGLKGENQRFLTALAEIMAEDV